MKVLLTSYARVTSKKDGKDYHIFNGVGQDGQNVDVVLSQERVEQLDIDVKSIKILPKEHLEEMFDASPIVEAAFNQRGQLVGLENIVS